MAQYVSIFYFIVVNIFVRNKDSGLVEQLLDLAMYFRMFGLVTRLAICVVCVLLI